MKNDVFISYSKTDKATAEAVCRALEAEHVSCWYAPRNIPSGDDWDASIMEALANSRVMILVWSSHSDKSRQVKREVAIALDDVGINLIPFRTEEIGSSKLRYYLGNIQWLDASGSLEDSLPRLVQQVKDALPKETDPAFPTEEQLQADATVIAPASTDSVPEQTAGNIQSKESAEAELLAQRKSAEEAERQRLQENQERADKLRLEREETEARRQKELEILQREEAEALRLKEAEAQRAQAEAEALKRKEAEAQRERAEAETLRLEEAEAQRALAEAEALKRKEAEAQRERAEAEALRHKEAEVQPALAALVLQQKVNAPETEPGKQDLELSEPTAESETARLQRISDFGSDQSRPNPRATVARIAIPAAVALVVIAGLAYAFWPAKDDERPSTAAVAANQTPTPESPTLTPTVDGQDPSQPSPTRPNASKLSPAKATPTPRKASTPEDAPYETEPPPPPEKRLPTPPRAPISGGVLNGKAISLPKPPYPPIARQAHASGTVVVQVTIDENGSVISARAVSGHPLLQPAAVSAARGARFTRTTLLGQPVKVTGVITYNFVAQ